MKTFQTTHFYHTNGKKTPFMLIEKQADNWFVLTNQKGFNIYCDAKTLRQEFSKVEVK